MNYLIIISFFYNNGLEYKYSILFNQINFFKLIAILNEKDDFMTIWIYFIFLTILKLNRVFIDYFFSPTLKNSKNLGTEDYIEFNYYKPLIMKFR